MLNLEQLFEEKTSYDTLGGKGQEVYNFAKTASTLADYGFSCNLITADKHGADMIAYHIESGKNMNIQLKGSRATLAQKYRGRNLWISYIDRKTNEVCLYNHDEAVKIFEKTPSAQTPSWLEGKKQYSSQSLYKHFDHIIIRKPIS